MMKILLIITLLTSVPFVLSYECDKAMEICEPEDDRGKNIVFPETAEELDAFCDYRISLAGCLYEILLDCKNYSEASVLENNIPVLEHMCNKDVELYHNLVIILPCFKNEYGPENNLQCHVMYSKEEFRKKFEEILINAGITDVTTEHRCFHKYFIDACIIGANGAVCGILGRKVALEFADVSDYGEVKGNYCSFEIKEKIPDISLEMEALYIETQGKLEEMEGKSEE